MNSLILNENQKRVLINEFDNDESKYFHLSKDSHLIYITFSCENKSLNEVHAELKQNSKLEIYNIVTSDMSTSIKQKVELLENGSSVQIMNLLLVTSDAELNSNIEIFHKAKNTSSDLSNYAISNKNSKIILNNNATIKAGCSSSIAHQSTKGLTLNKNSMIKALPNLFIDEYDVIANHACSIGSINKEDLFYLMSRGMTQTEASKIIVMGYVKPILDHIEDEELKKKVEKNFSTYLLK